MSRTKVEYRSCSKDNYDRFLTSNKISLERLSYPKYKQIIETCNWMFIEYTLETGSKLKLPYGFGEIAVNKKILKRYKEFEGKKYINLRIDWKKTKEAGTRVYHTNEHTDGFNYKWLWLKDSARFYFNKIYNFKPCRYASRALAKYINKPNSTYKELYNEWTRK